MVVDNLTLLLLVEEVGITPIVAKVGAVLLAILVTFLLNERYTYDPSDKSRQSIFRRYLKSNMVRALGVSIAMATLYVLHTIFAVWYVYANVVGIFAAFIVNYINESFITWRIHAQ